MGQMKSLRKWKVVAILIFVLAVILLLVDYGQLFGVIGSQEQQLGRYNSYVEESLPPTDAVDVGRGAVENRAYKSYSPKPESVGAPVTTNVTTIQPKIIKTGNITLNVEKDEFESVVASVKNIASSCNSIVANVQLSSGEYPQFYATYRIPVDVFDQCVERFQSIHENVSVQVSSYDQTTEYIDLKSRLEVLESQKEFYMNLLAKAETVEDMLKVRQYLDQTIAQIESIKRQMKYIEDQATYSTLSVSVITNFADISPKPWYIKDLEDTFLSALRILWKLILNMIWLSIILVPLLIIIMWFVETYGYRLYKRFRKGKEGDS